MYCTSRLSNVYGRSLFSGISRCLSSGQHSELISRCNVGHVQVFLGVGVFPYAGIFDVQVFVDVRAIVLVVIVSGDFRYSQFTALFEITPV